MQVPSVHVSSVLLTAIDRDACTKFVDFLTYIATIILLDADSTKATFSYHSDGKLWWRRVHAVSKPSLQRVQHRSDSVFRFGGFFSVLSLFAVLKKYQGERELHMCLYNGQMKMPVFSNRYYTALARMLQCSLTITTDYGSSIQFHALT